jgi:hypothetical protein
MMEAGKVQTGRRFSHVYVDRGAPIQESAKFRKRLGSFYMEFFSGYREPIVQALGRELGSSHDYLGEFFDKASLNDLLDSITVIYGVLRARTGHHTDWVKFVARAMREENLSFRVDNEGGVHYAVDRQFTADLATAVTALDTARFAKARDVFRAAVTRLDGHPPAAKDAVTGVFEAAETLIKIIFGEDRIARLEPPVVDRYLKPLAVERFKGNEPAINSAKQALSSFSDWITAVHQYRHGQGEASPIDPPLELAVYLVSLGASHIRWVASVAK